MTSPTQDTPVRGGKRKAAAEAQEKQADAMKKAASHGRSPIVVGDVVLIQVPTVDRAKTDPHHIPGVVVEITEKGFCRIGVIGGVLMDCRSRETLVTVPDKNPATYGLEDIMSSWKTAKAISVREAVKGISTTGGQGYTRCGCKGSCDTHSCKCLKGKFLCNSRCHPGSALCKNC